MPFHLAFIPSPEPLSSSWQMPPPPHSTFTASPHRLHFCSEDAKKEYQLWIHPEKEIQSLPFYLGKLLGSIKGQEMTLQSTRCNPEPVTSLLKQIRERRRETIPLGWLPLYCFCHINIQAWPIFCYLLLSVKCNINSSCWYLHFWVKYTYWSVVFGPSIWTLNTCCELESTSMFCLDLCA